jgi:parvulin-like peptidyl-prolyl isomerase
MTTALLHAAIAATLAVPPAAAPGPAASGAAVPPAPAASASAPEGSIDPGARSDTGAAGIVALWGDTTITWERIRPILGELAGGAALQEAILDELLERRARERKVEPDEAALANEERTLLGYLDKDPAKAERLLQEVRSRQGLGPVRWRALLRRNAMLRALVAPDVEVQEAQVVAAHDAAHGPRRGARVIAVPDLRAAQAAADRIAKGERFEDLAAELSTDPSAARGGLVNAMSRLDPSVPAAVREALWAIGEVGGTSPPVLVSSGYLLVRRGPDMPGDGIAIEAVRADAERAVRLAQERARMDALAQELLRGVDPQVLDEGIASSWRGLTTGATRSSRPPPG